MKSFEEECRRIAKDQAAELEAIADGRLIRCPHCGELAVITEDDDDEDKHTCGYCGAELTQEDIDEHRETFWTYFDDVYDIEYTIGGDMKYRSVKLMTACGGPNMYVDTGAGEVRINWGGTKAAYCITNDACSGIDDVFEEMYSNR